MCHTYTDFVCLCKRLIDTDQFCYRCLTQKEEILFSAEQWANEDSDKHICHNCELERDRDDHDEALANQPGMGVCYLRFLSVLGE